ncbi:MAG: ROK family protein [Planctomycetes bacterium]|nr:ROK family protein [Planctomycetota bacterium]
MKDIGSGPQARHRALILSELPPGAARSRKELSARTGLSPATVLRITRQLLKGRVLREAEARAQAGAGRPSPGLEINGRAGAVLGVSLLAPAARVLLLDFKGGLLLEFQAPLDLRRGADGVLTLLKGLLQKASRQLPAEAGPLAGVGVAVPGQWNKKDGLSLTYPRCIYVDDHVGLGAIANGEVLEGVSGNAGELGHLTVHPEGPLCYCGNTGCLEMLASCLAVLERMKESEGAPLRGAPAPQTFEEVATMARGGHPFASRLLGRAATLLGIGVAAALNLLNPQIVVLNGRFFDAGDLVLAPLRQSLQNRALPNTFQPVTIERSTLGPRAGALGAGVTAIRQALRAL